MSGRFLVALLLALLPEAPRVQATPLLFRADVAPGAARGRYLAVRAEGPLPALRGHRVAGYEQRSRLLPDGQTEVTIAISNPHAAPGIGAAPDDAALWSEPSGECAADPAVHRLASELALPDAGPAELVDRVLTWVSLNIAHEPLPAHDDSPGAALSAGHASCVGRSRLAVALLRCLGVPSRTVHGLLVPASARPGSVVGPGRFVLHRWVEAWIPGLGWVPSDPGESIHVIDARHVFVSLDSDAYDPEWQRGLSIRVAEAPSGLVLEGATPPAGAQLLVVRALPRIPVVLPPQTSTP